MSELSEIKIGNRVAEQDVEGLKSYFIKTSLWHSIIDEDTDVIFGCKGSGKSALYNYLATTEYDLLDKNVHLLLAENPKGASAFKDFNISPPKNEFEFKSIWKLYFIVLIAQKLSDENYTDSNLKIVTEKLQDSDLIQRRMSFTSIVRMVRDYIKKITIEPALGLDPNSGMPNKVAMKISLNEPSNKDADKGVVSVDNLLHCLNSSLELKGEKIWVTIDRLDAVFQENLDLETMALRTLFQVYIDLQVYNQFRLIIFLRDDIWNRIIEGGFREASHITRSDTIKWGKISLFNLIMSRFENNPQLLKSLMIDETSEERRNLLFAKIFPKKNSTGADFTFEWLVAKIRDGLDNASPRELIHIVSVAIKHEISLVEAKAAKRETLLSMDSLYEGIREASKTKLETVVAEYPKLKNLIYRLKGKKPRLKFEELKDLWSTSKKDTAILIKNLIKVGFFKDESSNEEYTDLLIPIIFRPALSIQYK